MTPLSPALDRGIIGVGVLRDAPGAIRPFESVSVLASSRQLSGTDTLSSGFFIGGEVMSVSKKIRFEVLKRDKFTCQYCGAEAPDVILHVDHIHPASKGGGDEIMNLVVSCKDCNLGKKARTLDDDMILKKRKRQLDELQERREQIEMMAEWQRSLLDIDQVAVKKLRCFGGSLPGTAGQKEVRQLYYRGYKGIVIKKY